MIKKKKTKKEEFSTRINEIKGCTFLEVRYGKVYMGQIHIRNPKQELVAVKKLITEHLKEIKKR